ncbi:hypothetical protein EHS13_16880 [Paenibacillus psychroresistens]|uniref:Uncharacterized protein n=1 Tax=Paenibacillus psychroresistens TaxID=1778678 RepID=A0A6B8RKR5_9BACL|nr:hypothetical protein [Paenibacillus psychroresistens]QGQ96437.1 hypothetical protein EHS13_16880 [Paenibacillus psychroresistens]
MFRIGLSIMYLCWIVILYIEVNKLYELSHSVHTIDDTIYSLSLIVVTLVVGAVGILIASGYDKTKKMH